MNFFFSGRRRHTRLQGDWSSDVCSSDLASRRGAEIDSTVAGALEDMGLTVVPGGGNAPADGELAAIASGDWAFAPRLELRGRSEERRVGKEWSGRRRTQKKEKRR